MRAWRPIKSAPLGASPILVRYGSGDRSCYRLVSFVDGGWMELSDGSALLDNEGDGSPTHWSPVPPFRGRTRKAGPTKSMAAGSEP